MPDFTFCSTCGSLKEVGKICRSCTNIIKTKEKSSRIQKEMEPRKSIQAKKKDFYKKKEFSNQKKVKRKHSIKYSAEGGMEWIFEPDYEETKRIKTAFCVKCKKYRIGYAGHWVRAGGRYASEETTKRIFLCTQCWNPNKKK